MVGCVEEPCVIWAENDYEEIGIDDDKSVCGVERSKKLMDYMERKGRGLGLMLDAYAKEVPNPRQLEPKFYSSSGSFHVVLPNLNLDH